MSREKVTIMNEFICRHINEAYQKLQVLLVVGHSLSLPCSKIFHKTTVPKNDPNVCLVYSFVLYQRNLKTSTLLEQTVLKFNQKNSEILLVLQGKD